MEWILTILSSLIVAGIPALVTLITSSRNFKHSKMASAKQAILQMILEDQVAVELMKQPPRNYVNIHYEYDIYHANGGNSDIDHKMKEYDAWYDQVSNKAKLTK